MIHIYHFLSLFLLIYKKRNIKISFVLNHSMINKSNFKKIYIIIKIKLLQNHTVNLVLYFI